MRLATIVSALAIIVGAAVFGAIFSQHTPIPVPAPSVAQAAAPAAVPEAVATDGTSLRGPTAPAAEAPATPMIVAQAAPRRRADPAAAPPPAPAPGGAPAPVAAPTPTAAAAPEPAATTAAAPAAPQQAESSTTSCPGNPNALGVSRTVEVDTTGGPGFGFEHFKSYDFLREGEVVLTFDDGPWPKNTPAVLAALAAHCTKAIFFPIGIHATWEPQILKHVLEGGHTVGSHTWCHQDLSKTKGHCRVNNKVIPVEYTGIDEIEKGISAVRWAAGPTTAPFFRFPALRQPPELIEYLGKRNIAIFSADFDSFDFKMRKPEQVRQSVMTKLKKNGKGIILMHDFQHATAEAAMALLNDLKAGGYKVVFMRAKAPVTTLAKYDEEVSKLVGPGGNAPPIAGVLKDVPQ
jgi:peptidoglycan-N-acetylglucosamine deacetylase